MDDKETLSKILELTEENNQILRKMRTAQRWTTFWYVIYYVIVIAIAIGAFYYIQPYFDTLVHLFRLVSGSNATSSIFSVFSR